MKRCVVTTPGVASDEYVIREAAMEHTSIFWDVLIDLYIFN